MILRSKLTKLQDARSGADDVTANNDLFSDYKSSNTETGLVTTATGYSYPKPTNPLFTGYKPMTTTTPTTPTLVTPKTSGTFGEVTKALGGSFVSGALNLISTAVGTAERSLVAGTDAEGKGIVAMWDNVIRSFSPETTKEERAKIAQDIVKVGLNFAHPETRALTGSNMFKDVYNLEGGSSAEQQVKKAETAVRSWSDIENESGLVKFFGGVGESLPASIVTRIPVVGWYLMGNQTYKNTMDQTRAEYQAKGEIMPEGLATLKALGYTAIEIGTEMLFPLFGKIGASAVKGSLGSATKGLVEMAIKKLGIKTAEEVAELSWKTVGKAMLKEATGEGVEEVLANLGQAGIAALTTNPDDPYWSTWSKDGGLTSLDSLFMSFASGAVMGGGMTAVRGGAKLMFKNTNNIVDDLKDKPIEQITPEEKQEFKDAVVLDFTQNENGEQEFITENVSKFIGKVAPVQGQTFKTKSGKQFTVPSNAEPNISNVSLPVLQDSIAQKATQAESIATQPQAVQTPVEAVAPSQTVNMPTAQAPIETTTTEGVAEPIKQRQLPENNKLIPEEGNYPAVRADDGTIYWDTTGKTHIELIKGENIPPERITSGGWLVDGVYTETTQSDTMRYVEQIKAQQRVTAKRASKQTTSTAEPIPAKKATTETKAKVTEEKPKAKPSVKKSDLLVKIANKQDVTKDIDAWLQTEEGIKETEGLKTPEEIALKIAQLKSEFDQFINKNMSNSRLLEINLQLLAYKSLADKLAKAGDIKGHRISLYAAKILKAIEKTSPKNVSNKLIGKFNTYDLIHEVYSDVQALEELKTRIEEANRMPGGFFADAMLLSRQLESNKKIPTKGDVLYLTEAVKQLMESVEENPTAIANAEKLVKRLNSLATKGGQFIQAFSVIKNIIPEYRAEKILKAYKKILDKDVAPEKIKELTDIIENLKDEIKKMRLDSAKKIGEKLDESAGKVKENRKRNNKQSKTKRTAADLFASRIMNSLETKEAKTKSDVESAVNNLYAKFKEVVPHKKTASERQNKYNVLAELILNRDKYSESWQSAREIIYLDETMNKEKGMSRENFDQIKQYFTEITEVSFIEKIVKQAVVQTIANMDKSVTELAQDFFFTGEESITEFTEAIEQEIAKTGIKMDATSFDILNRYLNTTFRKLISETHGKDIEKYAKSMNRHYNPKTYESEQAFIVDEVTKAAYYDVFADTESKVSQIWAKKLGIPFVTDDIKAIVYNAATEMARAKTEKEKDAIYDSMALQLASSIPSNLQEKVTAWLRTAMLFNPTTLVRNMISNLLVTLPYKQTDALANFFMKRMKGMPTDVQIAGNTVKKYNPKDAIGKVVENLSDDASIKRVQSQFAKYSLSQLFGMEKKIFKTKFLQTLTEIPYQLMSTGQYKNFKLKPLGDIYMFQKWYRESMYNRLNAMGYNENLSESEKQDMIDKAKEASALVATTRTFRQTNILSAIIKAMQNEANRHGKYGKVANIGLKVLVPFVVTPTALTVEAYKFSPIALAKSLVIDYGLAKVSGKWKGKDATYKANVANKVSQALVGTAFQFALGAVLSAFGLLTGDLPEDEDERKQWESQGKKPYSIYIPGAGYFTIDWAQPISTGIMAGAKTFQTLMDADATDFEKASSFVTAPLDVLYKSSVLQNITEQFGNNYGRTIDATTKAADFAQTGLFQAMPTLIKKLNRIIDPYERNVYSGNAVQVFFNRILQNVPGGTYAIAKKVDVWGNEVTSVPNTALGAFERVILNLMMPFTYSKDKMDDVTKEVTRVFNETSGTSGSKALPSIANKTITRTKDKVKSTWELTPSQYIEYQQEIGKRSKVEVEKLIRSGSYKGMTDEKKAEALAKIYAESVEKAGDKIVKQYPKTK